MGGGDRERVAGVGNLKGNESDLEIENRPEFGNFAF
jgi:hypothetical protein